MTDEWQEFQPLPDWPNKAYRRGGLRLSEVGDLIAGEVIPDHWSLSLETGEPLLTLVCDRATAFQIADDMAGLRGWESVDFWTHNVLAPEQIEIIARYPGQALPPLPIDTEDHFDD